MQRIEHDRFILLRLWHWQPRCHISERRSAFRSAVDVEGVGSLGEWTLVEPISCFCVCGLQLSPKRRDDMQFR